MISLQYLCLLLKVFIYLNFTSHILPSLGVHFVYNSAIHINEINTCVEVDRRSIVVVAENVLTKNYRNITRNNKSIWDTTKLTAHYFGQYIYSIQKYMVLGPLYVDNTFIVHVKRLIVVYQFLYIKSPAQNWVAN